ncbi:MAG TPA: hypothetical protein VFX20_11055 [Steroidobacteraceae bacterium]|nr:hypothetical protein [Steroidobacteraceae bacterium]
MSAPPRQVFRTGYDANDAYPQHIRWRPPTDHTRRRIAVLRQLTRDAPKTSGTVHIGAEGEFDRQLPDRTNHVVLIKLSEVR